MKAAIRVVPGRIEIQDVPEPTRADGETIVGVDTVALCGGDLQYYRGPMPFLHLLPLAVDAPYVLGHEAVGTVVDTAPSSPWQTGDRVVIDPQHRCGSCRACIAGEIQLCPHRRDMGYSADGVAAERITVSDARLYGVPVGLSNEVAAATHGLAATLHALQAVDLSTVRRALVTGPGPAGLMFAMGLLAKLGTKDVCVAGRQSPRLDIARDIGARAVSLESGGLSDMKFDWEKDNGLDLIVETTGAADVIETCVQCLAPKGALLLYAPNKFTLDGNILFRRELKVLGSSGATGGMEEALQLLDSGAVPLERIITHRFDLACIQDAFELALAAPKERGNFLKAVINLR